MNPDRCVKIVAIIWAALLAICAAVILLSCARYEHRTTTTYADGRVVEERIIARVFAADPRLNEFDLYRADGTKLRMKGQVSGAANSFQAVVDAISDAFEKGMIAGQAANTAQILPPL